MPGFGQPTLASVMRRVEADDVGLDRLDLTNNASFRMKPDSSITALSSALRSNVVVKVLILRELQIGDTVMEALAALLSENHTIIELDLQQNLITSNGVITLAQGLSKNRSVHTLNLMNQKTRTFGEACVESFKEVFQCNITLTKLQWQVNSRNTSSLAKCITRNIDIWRCVASGRDYCSLLPDHMREAPPDLLVPPVNRAPTTPCPTAATSPPKSSAPQAFEQASSPATSPVAEAEVAELTALAELAEVSALLGGDDVLMGAQDPRSPPQVEDDAKLPELDVVEEVDFAKSTTDKIPLPSVRWTPSSPPSLDPAQPNAEILDTSVASKPQFSIEASAQSASSVGKGDQAALSCASAGLADPATSSEAITSHVTAIEPVPEVSVMELSPEATSAEVVPERSGC